MFLAEAGLRLNSSRYFFLDLIFLSALGELSRLVFSPTVLNKSTAVESLAGESPDLIVDVFHLLRGEIGFSFFDSSRESHREN